MWGGVGVRGGGIKRWGLPLGLKVDGKKVYVREPTAQEGMRGQPPLTQFGRMCAELGIGMITAHSPQAKGRVERAHGTHQDRLVKQLRLKNITTHEAANRVIEQKYLAEHKPRVGEAAGEREENH